jgi:hypothetical protein
MASCMVTSYRPQAAQANEKPPSETFLNLTLMQHPCDEEPEPREVRARLEVEPSRLVLSYFAELPHPGDLVASRPRFR